MDTMSECGMDGFLSKPVRWRNWRCACRYSHNRIVSGGKWRIFPRNYTRSESGVYDLKMVAQELKIPVNVLESIGRDFLKNRCIA
jgi:hypothetical protein